MYIRKNQRKHKGKTYINYLLVESIRTEKGPRQNVVCSLGDLTPRSRGEWLKLAHMVEQALAGQPDLLDADDDNEVQDIVKKVRQHQNQKKIIGQKKQEQTRPEEELIAVQVDRVTVEEPREAGPVFVGTQFWHRLNLDEILCGCGLSERSRVLSCAMVLNRLIAPKAEHAMPDWIRRTALEDILDTDFSELGESSLYRNLDKLHPNRALIESKLFEREQELFNLDRTILLYDLTSTYFEGQANENAKAKRGYSRDKRPDCKQVVIGLVVNRDGFPIAHEIMEGNTQDRTTLGDMLDVLKGRVGLAEGSTVVVDRGMAYDDNIKEINDRKLKYMVASRQPERNQWLAEFEEGEDFEEVIRQPSPLNLMQKKSRVKVKMMKQGEETHILCVSSGRTNKDRAIREKHENRMKSDLEKLKKRIAKGRLKKADKIAEAMGRLKERYPRVARYYKMTYDEKEQEFLYQRDEDKYSKAAKLDGSYMLKTNRNDLSADEAWRIYSLLTRAEDAFRKMKSPLAERPIFHHLEHRVETHIFLCLLAYHLLVAIEKTLLDQDEHRSWAALREILSTHQVSTIVMPTADGSTLKIRKASTPDPIQKEIYRLLHIKGNVMQPKKCWISPNKIGSVVTEKQSELNNNKDLHT